MSDNKRRRFGKNSINRLVSVAPMMDCTDRHDRYFLRLISPNALLYTEMITAPALIHGDYEYLLKYDAFEHPVALQLGGSDPKQLAHCAKLGEDFGYDEINLNVGCPSDRVKSGQFGACLMLKPELVADCIAAMNSTVKIPVTVKCRIGVDEHDSYEELINFIRIVAAAGCEIFIIHARKAWLSGLSPKQNREVPPLRYEVVHQLKKDFPQLTFIINGGIKTVETVQEQLQLVDGVMIGREAYANPYFLCEIEKEVFSGEKLPSRVEIVKQFLPYINQEITRDTKLSSITRHILGLFHGQPNGRLWRRFLSENAHRPGGIAIVEQALALCTE